MRRDAKPESSRAATNRLLLDLRTRGWRPAGWAQFLAAATARSVEQAVVRRRALGQATALHGLFLIMGKGSRWRWVATSWALTALHLGMLEDRSHLGAANTLTLVRANLPVIGPALGPWLGISALTTDFVDGKLARHTGSTTPFGRYADPLADTVFWTWITFTHDGRGSRTVRIAVVLTWLSPILSVTAASFRRGQMVEPPRPRWIRPAVALEILIAIRAIRRRHTSPASQAAESGSELRPT
jgi:phosphatidylglycerophosphate synthase